MEVTMALDKKAAKELALACLLIHLHNTDPRGRYDGIPLAPIEDGTKVTVDNGYLVVSDPCGNELFRFLIALA
jgi:hypothetical protein